MTLQEAKDQIAQSYGYESWNKMAVVIDKQLIPRMHLVAELYAPQFREPSSPSLQETDPPHPHHNAKTLAVFTRNKQSEPVEHEKTSEIKLYNRADGLDGHYCVGRDRGCYSEYWTGETFSGFGKLYTSKRDAEEIANLLNAKGELEQLRKEIERLKAKIDFLRGTVKDQGYRYNKSVERNQALEESLKSEIEVNRVFRRCNEKDSARIKELEKEIEELKKGKAGEQEERECRHENTYSQGPYRAIVCRDCHEEL